MTTRAARFPSILSTVVAGLFCMLPSGAAAARPEPHAAYSAPAPRAPQVLSDRALARLRSEGRSVLWVFFTDKAERDAGSFARALRDAGERVTPRAMARRARETGGRFVPDFYDLAVPAPYVDAIAGTGARVRHVSKWLNAASVEADEAEARRISALPFVRIVTPARKSRRVEPVSVGPAQPGVDGGQGGSEGGSQGGADDGSQGGEFGGTGLSPECPSTCTGPGAGGSTALNKPANYGPAVTQLTGINAIAAHDSGWSAAGVIVSMFDTGYNKAHLANNQLKRIAERDFIFGDGETANEPADVASQWDHGTGTWSVLGGYWISNLIGPAYNAAFVLAKTEDTRSETPVEEDNWVAAAEWADSIGVDVISSSLAYFDFDGAGDDYAYMDLDGYTTVVTRGAIVAARRGIVVATAMANSGPLGRTLQAPADADSILSCGAVDSGNNIAGFSSRGNTADGRIKPEVVAQGVATWWALAANINSSGTANGTSLSTPLIGGAAALVREAHPEWTVAQIRDALKLTADKASTPDSVYGWGRINVVKAIYGSLHGGPVYPKPFNLLVPVNNGLVASAPVTFRWRRTVDPNPGDALTYTFELRTVTPDASIFTTTTPDSFTVFPGYLGPSTTYEWFVTANDPLSHGRESRERFRFTTSPTTGVGGTPPPSAPQVTLHQNRPNPVRSLTRIEYTLGGSSGAVSVTLRLFDARGRLVRTLVDERATTPTQCSIDWDGLDENGSRAGSGIYYYELSVAGKSYSKRLVLMR